jgi:membrane protease YdiL (CAAX protease family)
VEETVFRGFLWRGLAASRLGNWGAWLLTSVFFVATHTKYYADPAAIITVAIKGLILGLVRWRTGSSTAPMITHSIEPVAARRRHAVRRRRMAVNTHPVGRIRGF